MTESEFKLFEAVGALVVVLEADGRIAYWNHCCSELTGYSLDEVRGRKLWDFILLPEEVEPVKAAFGTLPTSTSPSPNANHWVTKTGERRWIVFSHSVTRHPDWRIQYIIKTGIDRTETKLAADAIQASEVRLSARASETQQLYDDARRVSEDLREANQHMVSATIRAQELTEKVEVALSRSQENERELRAIAELRERFLGIVSHDLRNPLATITMASEVLLARGRLDEEDRQGVSRIIGSSQRMGRMILQLLDFTRARLGGGIPIHAKPTDLRYVCREVADEFATTVRLAVEGDLTGSWDSDRLTDALANVARNASEHAAPGTPVVIKAHAEDGGVVVEIANQGDPIPPELLPFIFEPFRRGTGDRSSTGNLGLGLYIANQIVVASGGTLDVRCEGGTTTFVMRLPRQLPSPRSGQSRQHPLDHLVGRGDAQ